MYGTEVQRGTESAAQSLRSVLRALHEEGDVPAEVVAPRAPGRTASVGEDRPTRASRPEAATVAAGIRSESARRSAGRLRSAWAPLVRWYGAAQYRRRLPWLLAALVLHGLLFALFLLPQGAAPPLTPPEPIQTQIITEPHLTPAPPPLEPLALTRPPLQIVMPVPLVSIADPAALAASTARAAHTAALAVAVSSAPPAPAEPISPPQFDAAYLHNPAPEYPLQARRLREQGTVLLRVEVSAAGGALQVSIEHSSGWPILDDAALSAVRRWRFVAARQGRNPLAAWVLVPIEFDLHG